MAGRKSPRDSDDAGDTTDYTVMSMAARNRLHGDSGMVSDMPCVMKIAMSNLDNIGNSDLMQIVHKAQEALAAGGTSALSTGEAVAAALVLNRPIGS